MNNQQDFIAKVTYLTTEQGGRVTPAFSGYRPQIKFAFDVMQTSGQQIFIDTDKVYPGETVKATIKLLSPHFFEHKLYTDLNFEFREGNQLIGTGIIVEIKNELLKLK